MSKKLLGVVLCGGRSRRMGRDKAGLSHPKGGTLLQFAIARMSPLCDEVVVSGKTAIEHEARTLEDPVAHQGPVVGVVAALEEARRCGMDACLVNPVDTPRLRSEDLTLLVDAWRETQWSVIAHSGRLEPLIAIYPISIAAELSSLAKSENRSLYRWIQQHEHKTVPLGSDVCHNVNTPEDDDESRRIPF